MRASKVLLFVILIWIPSLVVSFIFSILMELNDLRLPFQPEIPVLIANRIGVEPEWEAINNYVHNDAFRLGMTREEVLEAMNKIGPWYEDADPSGAETAAVEDIIMGPVFTEQLRFTEYYTQAHVGGWAFEYRYGKLVHFHRLGL